MGKSRSAGSRAVERVRTAQRIIVCGTVLASVLVVTPSGYDAFSLFKAAVVVVGAAACVGGGLALALTTRRVSYPANPALVGALGLFLVALLIATVAAPSTWTAVVGLLGRNVGLAVYVAGIVLLLVVSLAFEPRHIRLLLGVILAGAAAVMAYGLVQFMGWDPVPWDFSTLGSNVVGTLGNPNFSAAYVGLGAPLALWAVLTEPRRVWRLGAGALLAGLLVVAVLTESFQGPLVAVAGCWVVAIAYVLEWSGRRRKTGLVVLAGLVPVGGLALAAGLAGVGPLALLAGKETIQIRLWYWEAALRMLRDHPWTGVGLDHYSAYYRAYRPAGTAQIRATISADKPHNVVLDMFASGGLPLGVAYLAVLSIIAFVLVRGLSRTSGAERLLLGAVGGAWTAYVLQALISIDMPPLVATGWVLGGAILVLGGGVRWRAWPGMPVVAGVAAGRSRSAPSSGVRSLSAPGIAAWAVVVVGAVVAVAPLVRANALAGDARGAVARGEFDAGLEGFARAYELAPGEDRYLEEIGLTQVRAGQPEAGLETFRTLLTRDPRSFSAAVNGARLAHRLGREEEARDLYRLALELDPVVPLVKNEFAAFLLAHDDAAPAVALLEDSVRLSAASREAWELLSAAYEAAGRPQDADEAMARARALPEPAPAPAT